MPRIKKTVMSKELLEQIRDRGDYPLNCRSIGEYTVGDKFRGRAILGFVILKDEVWMNRDNPYIHKIREGNDKDKPRPAGDGFNPLVIFSEVDREHKN